MSQLLRLHSLRSDELKGDREIVMEAVSQNWEALHWASAELKRDKEIVMKAFTLVPETARRPVKHRLRVDKGRHPRGSFGGVL